jgi:predicted aldo/keto reductase-like oxidoreductase
MITRRFGRTHLDMPIFSTGGMRYQMSWSGPKPDELDKKNQTNLDEILSKSLQLGCRHIETARGYGTSEYQLGIALKKHKREDYILQTKVTPFQDPKEFKETLDLSLSLLDVDRVDLFGFHGVNLPEHLDWITRDGGCLEVIRDYQQKGKVGHIGFSTHARSQDIQQAIETDMFDYVNLHWYYIDRSNDACLTAAQERDMGLFIISPNDKGGKLYDPPEKLSQLTAPLSPMVFNDLFCLKDPRVHTLSLGVSKPSDFDEHMKALPILENGDESQVIEIEQRLDAQFESAVGTERLQQVRSFSQYHDCPHHVNLKVIFRLWSLAKAFDMKHYGTMRYNLLGNGGHWFPGIKPSPEHLLDLETYLSGFPSGKELYSALQESIQWFKGEEQKRLSLSESPKKT